MNGWYHDDCIHLCVQSVVQAAQKKNSLVEKFVGWIFSSSPSRQSIWLSLRLSICKHTPVLQRKLLPLQPGTQTEHSVREETCSMLICECLFDLLLQHISSLRSPQSSMPSQVLLRGTHFVFTHLKPHSSPEKPEKAEVWREQQNTASSHHSCLFISVQHLTQWFWNVLKCYLSQLVGPDARCYRSTCVIRPANEELKRLPSPSKLVRDPCLFGDSFCLGGNLGSILSIAF